MAVAVWTSFQQISNSTTAGTTPYAGAKVNVYAAGTTTPVTVYSDKDLMSAAANPIICDSSGQHPMRYIATASYKTSVTDSADVPLTNWSKDNIDPGTATVAGIVAIANGGTGSGTAGGARTNLGAAAESTVTAIAADVVTAQNDITALEGLPLGQGQLAKSGANLVLSPFRGNRLIINGVIETIPSAGVSLSVGALGNTTLYYVYAYMDTGTMTLEAVTTTYTTQTSTGMRVKSGDATRTLVGMCYLSGGAFIDSVTQRFVRSWLNDPGIATLSAFSANRTAASTSFVEFNSEIRNEFLTWSGEIVHVTANGGFVSATNVAFASIAFNGTSAEDTTNKFDSTSVDGAISMTLAKTGLTEGYNYVTMIGKDSSGSLILVGSANVGERTTLKCTMRS